MPMQEEINCPYLLPDSSLPDSLQPDSLLPDSLLPEISPGLKQPLGEFFFYT